MSDYQGEGVWDFTGIGGRDKPLKRYEIFDANGIQWHHVRRCNTRTGELWYYPRGDDGTVLRGANGMPEEVHVKTAAPLLVKECKNDNV